MNAKDQIARHLPSIEELEQRRKRRHQRRVEVATLQAAAIHDPAALLHIATVTSVVGLQRTAIYDGVRAGTFPPPIRLSARCSRWPAGAIRQWLDTQAAK